MSDVIDNKVVELQLDNTNFEKNSKQSIKTLAQLEYAMNISTAETNKSLLEINKTLAAMPLQKIADGVDATAQRFTLLGQIGFSVINNLTNQLTNMATRMTMNLTTGQKQAGFSEYQLKMNSTRTIMSATGRSIEDVNEQLEKLNEYADQTIYSFSDMTQNIGKFTNAGVKLEDAVEAIKGVSSLAAVSGADANQASRAMYNFAQALGTGSVKLIDWKSISNATMDTIEFKNEILKTAEALGTIKKQGDKYVSLLADPKSKKAAEEFTAENMQYALETGWFTSDVLIETLKKYTNENTKLGKKAMEAATEVRTFSQLMDTLKESSGSAWSKTFELIFGDMNEATQLWTAINDKITKMLDKFAAVRNIPLQVLHDNGGRTYLKNIFEVMGKGIKGFVDPIKQAWREVFPPWPKSWLLDLVQRLERFMTSLKGDAEAMHAVGQIFKFFFSILKVGINVIKSMFRGLKIFSPAAKEAGSGARGLLIAIGNLAEGANEKMAKMNYTIKIADALKTVFKGLANITAELIRYFKKLANGSYDLGSAMKKMFRDIASGLNEIYKTTGLKDIGDDLKGFFVKTRDRLIEISDATEKLFKTDDYSGFKNIDSSKLTEMIMSVYKAYSNVKDVIVAFKKGVIKVGSIIRVSVSDTFKYIFSNEGFIQLVLLGLAASLLRIVESLRVFSISLNRASKGLSIKWTLNAVADIIEQLRLALTDLAKFAISLTAIYLLLPEDLADKSIDQSLRLMKAMMMFMGAMAVIAMIAQIVYGKSINRSMQVGLHAAETKGITLKENPIAAIKAGFTALTANNTMAKIVDESTDFMGKMARAMGVFAVSLAVIAYSMKKAPNETEQAIDIIQQVVVTFLVVEGVIMGLAFKLIDIVLKNDKLDADKLNAVSKAIDNFTDVPGKLVEPLSKLFISVGVFALFLATAKKINPFVTLDVIGIMIVIFGFLTAFTAGLFLAMYLLNKAISKGKGTDETIKNMEALSKIVDSVTNVMKAVTEPVAKLLAEIVVLSILAKRFSSLSQIGIVLVTFAAMIIILVGSVIVLFNKIMEKDQEIENDQDKTTKFQKMADGLVKILNAVTKSVKSLLHPFLGLSVIFTITAAVNKNAFGPMLMAFGAVFILLEALFGGINNMLTASQTSKIDENAVKSIETVTKTLSKVMTIMSVMIGVVLAFVVFSGYYSKQFKVDYDFSIFSSIGLFALGFSVGLATLAVAITVCVEKIARIDNKSLDDINAIVQKITGVIITITALMTIMTFVVSAVAILGDISELGPALTGLGAAFLMIGASLAIMIFAITSIFVRLSKEKLDGRSTKKNMDILTSLIKVVMQIFITLAIAATVFSLVNVNWEDFAIFASTFAVAMGAVLLIIPIILLIKKVAAGLSKTDMTAFSIIMAVITGCVATMFILATQASASGVDGKGTLLWMTSFAVAIVAFAIAVFTAITILNTGKSAAIGAAIAITTFAIGILAIIGIGALFVATVDMLCNSINKLIILADRKEELAKVADVMPEIAKNFGIAIEYVGKMLSSKSDVIADAMVRTFVVSPLLALAKSLPIINIALKDIVIGLVPILNDLGNLLGVLVYNMLVLLENWIPQWAYALVRLVVKLVQALCDIVKHLDILVYLVADALWSILAGALNVFSGGVLGQLLDPIIDGIRYMMEERLDSLGNDMGAYLVGGFKESLEIHSPSKVMKQLGGYIVEGLADGLLGGEGKLSSVTDGLVSTITSKFGLDGLIGGLKDQFGGFKDMFNGGGINNILGDALGDKTGNLLGDFDLTKTLNLKLNVDDPDNALDILNNTDGYNSTSVDILGSATSGESSSSYADSVSTSVSKSEARKSILEEYRRRAAQYDDSTVVKLLDGMNSSIQTMGERMLNTQIVMDDGALVGEMKSPLDTELGNMSRLRSRERFATN